MRRNWQTIPLVVIVGALAGAAIAGRPTDPPNDVRITGTTAPASTTTLAVTTTAAAATTTAPTSTTTTDDSTTTEPATTTTAPRTTTTTAPRSTTTTAPRTTTTVAPGPTGDDEPAPESERATIRVIVVNATNSSGLASRYATLLTALGYVDVIAADTARPFGFSVIFAADEFRAQALRVADDLGIAPELVVEPDGTPVTGDDARGDVILVLSADRI